jgi:hypothetical protein
MTMNIVGFGRIMVWQGGSLWIGQASRVQPHSHHGIQIGVALDGELLFEWTGEWHPYRLAVIPSRLRHAMDAQGRLGAQIFVEPESPAGRILIENFCGNRRIGSPDFELVASSAHRLLSNFLAGADADLLVDDARAVISDLTSGSQPRNVTDPRILTAIELMTRKLDMNLTLRHVAR